MINRDMIRNPNCRECLLGRTPDVINKCITGDLTGTKKHKLIVVSMYPTKQDDQNNAVMSSSRDDVFWLIWEKALKLTREDAYFTHFIKCHPYEREITEEELLLCGKVLIDEIVYHNPTVVLFLGDYGSSKIFKNAGYGRFGETALMQHYGKTLYTYSPNSTKKKKELIPFMAEHISLAVKTALEEPRHIESNTKIISNYQQVELLVELIKKHKIVCIDVETTSLDNPQVSTEEVMTCISFSYKTGISYVLPIDHQEATFDYNDSLDLLNKEVFGNTNIIKVAHNFKFEAHWLEAYGIKNIKGKWIDTMMMSFLIENNRKHGLKLLVNDYIPELSGYDAEMNKYSFKDVPLNILANYNGMDTEVTLRLYYLFLEIINDDKKLKTLFENIICPSTKVLFQAESHGMLVDKEKLEQLIVNVDKELNELYSSMENNNTVKRYFINKNKTLKANYVDELEKFIESNPKDEKSLQELEDIKTGKKTVDEKLNIGNIKQLLDIIYFSPEGFRCKPIKDKNLKEQWSTTKNILEKLDIDDDFKNDILTYRGINNIKTNHIDNIHKLLSPNNTVHCNYLQHGNPTGRISCTNPNLQNITMRSDFQKVLNIADSLRECFIVPAGYSMVEVDYSQMEIRLIAFLAQEETMLKVFSEDGDIHIETACMILDIDKDEFNKLSLEEREQQRYRAKAINFSLIYLSGVNTFIEEAWTKYGIKFTIQEATTIRRKFFEKYSGLKRYYQDTIDECREHGYVRTLLGNKIHLPNINSDNDTLAVIAERCAINNKIQGSGGLIPQFASILNYIDLDKRVIFVNNKHDALLYYVPNDVLGESIAIIKDNCENLPLKEYFDVDITEGFLKCDIKISKDNWKNIK